jgi:guanylate kinase
MGGKLLIFSAPSGSGKTTLVKHILNLRQDVRFSISATSRLPRGDEKHGTDYYFFSREEFAKKIENGDFLEYEEVYKGVYYGTLHSEVDRLFAEGYHVVFDIDVKGGKHLKTKFGDQALAVFVKVPSIEILKERLVMRSTDSEEKIAERIAKATVEMQAEDQFDVTIVNDNLERAKEEALTLVENFLNS